MTVTYSYPNGFDLDTVLYGPDGPAKDELIAYYTLIDGSFDEVTYELNRATLLKAA